jgi:hypothetical protein
MWQEVVVPWNHDICLDWLKKTAINVIEAILSWDRDLNQRLPKCYPLERKELVLIGW